MGACCTYAISGGYVIGACGHPTACSNMFDQELCEGPFCNTDPGWFSVFFSGTWCEWLQLEHADDPLWHADGCPREMHVCCTPTGCVQSYSTEDCESKGGVYDNTRQVCDTDVCKTACCWPVRPYGCYNLFGNTCDEAGGARPPGYFHECAPNFCAPACCHTNGTCSTTLATVCKQQGGTVMWGQTCTDHPCEPPANPCCLCRGQCLDTSEQACANLDGEWQDDLSNCTGAAARCANAAVLPRCRTDRFNVARETSSPSVARYRPLSQGKMNPHEYVQGPEGANCRNWRANVSAAQGAWTCGQPDMTDPETKAYFRLSVSIHSTTGRGSFWAKYRPVCPDYTPPEE